MTRLRELDFLRGIAILLVLLRHSPLINTSNIGWIGVDLFFVLSGYLVSGLLFREYLKFGNIKPKLFLIRRGFKIYPLYYLTYPLYLIPILYAGKLNIPGILSDLTFTQNYLLDWSYANEASWSLAVEEHFYFGFTLVFWLYIKYRPNVNVTATFILCMFLILLFRFFSNRIFPLMYVRNFTMTHLRIDSLLAGVLISYWYHFRITDLQRIFNRYKIFLLLIAGLFLCWVPFKEPTFYEPIKVYGFSLVYISFGIIIIYFVLNPKINQILNKLFTRPVVDIISKIGFCSYSIYLIHRLLIIVCRSLLNGYAFYDILAVKFVLHSATAIIAGMYITKVVESYFLAIRNMVYPSRGINVIQIEAR